MKQHRLFSQGHEQHPRALTHMRRVGHFEFGLNRRPINLGDQQAVDKVRALWQRGEEEAIIAEETDGAAARIGYATEAVSTTG